MLAGVENSSSTTGRSFLWWHCNISHCNTCNFSGFQFVWRSEDSHSQSACTLQGDYSSLRGRCQRLSCNWLKRMAGSFVFLGFPLCIHLSVHLSFVLCDTPQQTHIVHKSHVCMCIWCMHTYREVCDGFCGLKLLFKRLWEKWKPCAASISF